MTMLDNKDIHVDKLIQYFRARNVYNFGFYT